MINHDHFIHAKRARRSISTRCTSPTRPALVPEFGGMDGAATNHPAETSFRLELRRLFGPELDLPATTEGFWLLGRGPDCDLILAHASVSRHHARLDLDRGRIEDLGSSAGTRVNDVLIKSQALKAGDRIQIGPWQFAVTDAGNLATGATVQRAAMTTALAAPRLDLLLKFSETINQADTASEIYSTLTEVAMAGSGCQRAVVIDLDDASLPVLAQSAIHTAPFVASRQLIDASREGGVIQLSELAVGERSASIRARRLISATAVALMNNGVPCACLYLDARDGEATEMPDTARFCQALARMADLALARLHQQQALWQQRERIYADLHDDLGARLLNMIYRAQDTASADEARAMLEDLRDVVSRPAQDQLALPDLLAEIRSEMARRTEAAGIRFSWLTQTLPEPLLWSNRAAALLSRSLREALSNALRHAQPEEIDVQVEARAGRLVLALAHDGQFLPPDQWSPGRGTRSLSERCRALGGTITWSARHGDLETCLNLPLEPRT
ncbi:MAG: FHA domain-containing protein [Wenzhouxiangella sp.]|nr:MAG: FHA domain-containing protein [Wenzhouxiangella sp.]